MQEDDFLYITWHVKLKVSGVDGMKRTPYRAAGTNAGNERERDGSAEVTENGKGIEKRQDLVMTKAVGDAGKTSCA